MTVTNHPQMHLASQPTWATPVCRRRDISAGPITTIHDLWASQGWDTASDVTKCSMLWDPYTALPLGAQFIRRDGRLACTTLDVALQWAPTNGCHASDPGTQTAAIQRTTHDMAGDQRLLGPDSFVAVDVGFPAGYFPSFGQGVNMTGYHVTVRGSKELSRSSIFMQQTSLGLTTARPRALSDDSRSTVAALGYAVLFRSHRFLIWPTVVLVLGRSGAFWAPRYPESSQPAGHLASLRRERGWEPLLVADNRILPLLGSVYLSTERICNMKASRLISVPSHVHLH
ncbi:hypothetical protein BO94DRAFT_315055 [Aspergillus sclerotioniger CBS 115572]|uniref:Uncharacterized protein n=1 Tax=Aspergillus sclerotioniger CBS 115572 TaxID=1450535 RepID=A0A317X8E8_9EURO|nr:hypothetical protein BO94DRAFT_315055 [Aspergillus sclerotioniger CBS 115572]PWY93942.1 hypothetical protein BO94DRAFT_315055 [Aspergillus sclerotioniger CBS 115572]